MSERRVYSIVQHDNGRCGVCETDPDGGSMTRNFEDTLTALEFFGAIMTGPRCRECSQPQVFGWVEKVEKDMREWGVCFGCRFWTKRAAEIGPHVVYADGCRYTIKADPPKGFRGFVGHGGAEFRIRFKDGREVVTHNLWSQGEIPEPWRKRLPDNAVFLSREHGAYHGGGSAGCGA